MRYSWTAEEVDAKLHQIMVNIFHNAYNASKKYGFEGNLVMGANIAGFDKVAESMIAPVSYTHLLTATVRLQLKLIFPNWAENMNHTIR